jgi:3-(3-hydroxy-phenyl)propionate hydroxylase
VHGLAALPDGRTYRVVTTEPQLGSSAEPTLTDLRASLTAAFGTDFGIHDPTWISRFTDATRQAATYRSGRVLLAGDAAHIHYPAGGQGIGLGVQDAVNLGWKLAQVVRGTSDPSLLDSYHAERHPQGARALQLSMAQTAVQGTDPRVGALGELMEDALTTAPAHRRLAARIHGLDIAYALADGPPLLGRRMPDLDIDTPAGATTVFALLHGARGLLLDVAGTGRTDATPWSDRVDTVEARCLGTWELPVVGEIEVPTTVLVRPDGYVAWVDPGTDVALTAALVRWFGPR